MYRYDGNFVGQFISGDLFGQKVSEILSRINSEFGNRFYTNAIQFSFDGKIQFARNCILRRQLLAILGARA